MKKGILKIRLKSDLCIGSGLSYAGIIDQDVVYDANGFPYIPARRLKGCLREAAELFADRTLTDRLLGAAGQPAPGTIYLENAVLSDAANLQEEICRIKSVPYLKEHLRPEDVLALFTSVRAQTAVDEKTGTAKENTLRMIRVVNQHHPLKETKPLCFEAQVCYEEDETTEVTRFLTTAAKAVRHIGMNRNRGLGNVSCEFCPDKDKGSANKAGTHHDRAETFRGRAEGSQELYGGVEKSLVNPLLNIVESDGRVSITYALTNTEPMMLSDLDKDETVSYISAKSVIGVLAAAYLKEKRNTAESFGTGSDKANPADSDEFADLFLNGTVRYYNANPSTGGKRAFPAPLYLNRLKKTKKYVNLLADEEERRAVSQENPDYDPGNGNQPKKLKGKYLTVTESDEPACGLVWDVAEPEREMSFHHRHDHGGDAPEAILYSQEALAAWQQFIGMVEAPSEYRELLVELFESADFRFGKSKNAQYGACHLTPCRESARPCLHTYKAGDEIAVTLLSDGIFIREDEAGNAFYTVRVDEVWELIAAQLGIRAKTGQAADAKTMLQTTTTSGYNTKWNRRRESSSAVQAGSVFVYVLDEPWDGNVPGTKIRGGMEKTPVTFVGERNQEGYGEILVMPLSRMHYQVETPGNNGQTLTEAEGKNPDDTSTASAKDPLSEEMQTALCRILKPKMIRSLMEEEQKKDDANRLTASAIGRVTLMVKECAAQYEDADELASELMKRVKSIKKENTKKEAMRLIPCVKDGKVDTDAVARQLAAKKGMEVLQNGNRSICEEKKHELLKQVWREWLLQKLALMKYRKKGE